MDLTLHSWRGRAELTMNDRKILHLVIDLSGFGGAEMTLLRYLSAHADTAGTHHVLALRGLKPGASVGATLKAKGIDASSAVINSGSAYSLPELPVFTPFNHVITYLPEWDLYVDATQELAPFGELGDHIVGKTTLLTALNKIGKTPKLTPDNNRIITDINIKILPNGDMQGTSKTIFKGNREIAARYKYEGHVTTRAEKMVEDHLYKFRQTGTGKFKTTNVFDLDTPFELSTEFKLDPITNFPGPGAMTVPVGLSPGNITLISFNKPKDKFYFPYECTSGYVEENTTLEFPKKAKIGTIPKSIKYQEKGTEYTSTYQKISDTKLNIKRTLKLQKPSMVCQPEELKYWQNMYQVIKKDLRSQIFYEWICQTRIVAWRDTQRYLE